MAFQKITPFLWFDHQAEEAAKFYVSMFDRSSVKMTTPGPTGGVLTVAFTLDGVEFVALNGGPAHKFTEAISFVVTCKDQAEIDRFWDGLTAGGGAPGRCGWLKDRFGVSWQIVPEGLGELMRSPGAVAALMKMSKLEIEKLRQAR